ncbi:MAG: thiosulfate oxidation carrier protein SoxY [Gemmatimonadaceae bacterium]|nr:thiosulfate oxidation carrier protein SoxY [Gemmatimonadaceae bacterium]
MRDSLSRRTFLKSSALAVAGLAASSGAAVAAPLLRTPDDEPDEETKKVLREKFGERPIGKGRVTLDVPDVAPDSREVPLLIESDLPMTADNFVKGIHIIVDHNPDIYLAGFAFTAAIGAATLDTRIKMRRSSHIRIIAETSRGELWSTSRFVYTSLNGCV